MGSMFMLLAASVIFITSGIRYTTSSILTHTKSSRPCSAKPWYFSAENKKNIDIYLILVTLPIGSVLEIFWFSKSNANSLVSVSYLDQAALLMAFWVLIILLCMTKKTETHKDFAKKPETLQGFSKKLENQQEFLFLCGGIVFALEWMVVTQGTSGIEYEFYNHLSFISLVCSVCCVLLGIKRGFFIAEIGLGCGLVLQGTWILQTGFALFVPLFMPRGCHRLSEMPVNGGGAVQCVLEEDKMRAFAFVDLFFMCHVIFVMVLSGFVCLLVGWLCGRGHEGGYSPIDSESGQVQMQAMQKFDIE